MFNINLKKIAPFTLLAIFFVFLDRFLKLLALNFDGQKEIKLIGDYFKFNFAENYNIAFSLPLSGIFLTILIFLIIVALIWFLLLFIKSGQYTESGLFIFLILGSASNLFDRLKYGYVIDYLDLEYFTVFNLADAMIVCSTLILVFLMYKNEKK